MASVLISAATKGDLTLLQETLSGEHGELNVEEIKEAVLRATCHGYKECLARLLKYGADPNCEDNDGDTPLMIAASNNSIEIVRLLIASGCDVDVRSERNRTALHMAVWNRQAEIVKILLRTDCDMDVRDRYGDTPLMLCARRGYAEIMKMLLKSGCDVCKKNQENDTALHYAARHGHSDCVQLLLTVPLVDVNARTIWGFGPLALATMNGFTQVALILIGAGADISARDRSEKTVLHHAIKKNLADVVEWLLELGADVNAVDTDGNSPLFEALNGGSILPLMLRLLVQFGANLKVVGRATLNCQYCWCSPLEFAVLTGNLPAAKLLHAAGCDFTDFQKSLDLDTVSESNGMKDWVTEAVGSTRRLTHLARLEIRSFMGVHLKEKVSRLPLPQSVKVFVSYADDDEFDGP